MKRLLLVAFYFWPRNHVASNRSGCFAKYLPENGWLPTVVCEDWPEGNADYDAAPLTRIPSEVAIHRILKPPARGLYARVITRRLFPYLWPHRSPYLWWQQARSRMLSLLSQERFDAVWATSDPLTPIALAEEAAGRHRLPWVMDIRDSYNVQPWGSWYKRPFFAHQERRLARKASHVVTVSEGQAEGLSARIRREIRIIHNGFDPQAFESVPGQRCSRFRIVYAGSVHWPEMNPAPFLEAVYQCIHANLIPRDRIEVLFYGSEPEALKQAYGHRLDTLPVRLLPRVPHAEIVRVLKASALLLVLTVPGHRGLLAAKLFDCLGAARPVLAVPDDRGDMSTLLERCGAGTSASTVPEIADQLTQYYQAWEQNPDFNLPRHESEIAKYSRREQTKQLAELLNELTTATVARER